VTQQVVIFATGSPIVVDLEESLQRAGITLRAGVRNREGECFLSDARLAVPVDQLTDELTRLPFLLPLFTPYNRQLAQREAQARGFREAFSLIDPTTPAPRSMQAGPGLYVNSGCTLGAASRFGAFVFLNRGVSVGHHANFGDFVSIGPGAVIAGQVTIGKGAVVGAGATVLPEIVIGENAVIGAGAVVTRNVPDGALVLGVPARVSKTGIGGYKGKGVD
jgi:sugar O-acyltransferase (sialic acid O-acetyltransferase NeuD family)